MKKKILIITDNYEYTGGIRTMADHIAYRNKENDVTIASVFSKRIINTDHRVCKVNFPFDFIYLIKALFVPLFLINRIRNADKIYMVSPTPLFGFKMRYFKKDMTMWYATNFVDEYSAKYMPSHGLIGKIQYIIDMITLPFVHICERLALQSRNIEIFALSNKSAKFHKIKRKMNIMHYPIEDFWKKSPDVKKEGFVFSAARFNDTRKGLDVLIKTASLLKHIKFIVAGPVHEWIDKTKYTNIEFLGELKRERLKYYYDRASLFYLPSRQEGLGIVYLEALACGLFVITMKNGGSEDIIENGVNGYLVEKDDHKKAAELIEKIVSGSVL